MPVAFYSRLERDKAVHPTVKAKQFRHGKIAMAGHMASSAIAGLVLSLTCRCD